MAWNSELLAHQIGNVGSRLFGIPTAQDRQRQQQEEAVAGLVPHLPTNDPRSSILQSALQGAIGTPGFQDLYGQGMNAAFALNAPQEQPEMSPAARALARARERFGNDYEAIERDMRLQGFAPNPNEIVAGIPTDPAMREAYYRKLMPWLSDSMDQRAEAEYEQRLAEYEKKAGIDIENDKALIDHRLEVEAKHRAEEVKPIWQDVRDDLIRDTLVTISTGEMGSMIDRMNWLDTLTTDKKNEIEGIYGGSTMARLSERIIEKGGEAQSRADVRVQIEHFLADLNLAALERLTGNPTDEDAKIARKAATRLADFELSSDEAIIEFNNLKTALRSMIEKGLAIGQAHGGDLIMQTTIDNLRSKL